MTLPVSSYEELLVQVRELTHETILLQKQLSSELFDNSDPPDVNHNFSFGQKNYESGKHLADTVIRQCIDARKAEANQGPLAEYNNLRIRPRFYEQLDPNESIRPGELTSRLLAWGNQNQHQLQEESESCRKPQCVDRPVAEARRVGVDALENIGGRRVEERQDRFERRPHGGVDSLTPLTSSVAAHEPSAEGAAAFNTSTSSNSSTSTSSSSVVVVAAPAPQPATSARCACGLKSTALKTVAFPSGTLDANHHPARSYLTSAELRKEDAMEPEAKEEDERRSSTPSPEDYMRKNKRYNEGGGSSEEDSRADSSLQGHRLPSSYRGTWPIRRDLWAIQQMGFSGQQSTSLAARNDVASVMSFSSNSGGALGCTSDRELQGDRRLGAKMDVVYNLLGMLDSTEGREDMSATLLSMSNSIDSCLVMRQSGCLPLLVQLIHAPGQDSETRERASKALHNVVHAKSDERAGRREARVLRFLEQLREYCQALRMSLETGEIPDDLERHPGPTIAALMKLSFDEAHRHAMCQLGGLHAVAELIEMDHTAHGSECDDQNCITLRRYAGMALTNLTFGDGNNKALLCSFREFMKALVSQLRSPSDDLRQVTASVLRNLSWRADSASKQTLREVGAVTGLMKAAMEGRKESTLKSILSALWNLSAHCSTNKVDICAVDGALAFLVDMLSYKAPSKTLAIVENAGGILRNVSSHIAVREDYRAIVRERGCLQVLLQQLRSPSLTVVSNACGTLWNLSARCPQDQRLLWDLGAIPMLRSLVHSKHKIISMGSSAALKNLLSARPGSSNLVHLDSTARGLGLPTLPTLVARRQRALEQEIDQNLAETCDNIEPSTSPTNKDDKFTFKMEHSFLGLNARGLRNCQMHNQPGTSAPKGTNGVPRSESRDSMRSITSTHSDTMFERVNRHVLNGLSPSELQIKQQSSSLHSAVQGFDSAVPVEAAHSKTTSSEQKYTLRYKNAVPSRARPSESYAEGSELRCTNSTISWSSAPCQESTCSQILLHSSVEDNLSLSASKTGSQSSVSEEADRTVCAKSEYQRIAVNPPTSDSSSSLNYSEDPPMKENVNFGNTYSENTVRQHDALSTIQKAISPTSSNPEGNLFSDYAETDLDQPTDYSLRYAEQTLEDEENKHSGYFEASEQELIHEDTIKTYCTEGTPHETSLNSSRAPSASDLQDDNRLRNSGKKLLEPIKLEIKGSSTYEGSDTDKSSDFMETARDFEDIASAAEGCGSTRSPLSLRTTPTQTASEPRLAKSEKFGKDSPMIEVSSYSGCALKTSNDSGYQVSDGDEDDEDLLTACINIGMQNNRHRHSFIGNSFEKLPRTDSNLTRYQTSVALDQMDSNVSDEAAINDLETKKAPCEDESTTSSDYQDVLSEFDQNASKSDRKVYETQATCPGLNVETAIKVERMNERREPGTRASSEHLQSGSAIDEETLCNFSLPSNLRNSPIGVAFATQSHPEEYLSSMETQSNEDTSSLPQQEFVEEDKILTEEEKESRMIEEKAMQQSYTKVTDSESSESIDSVEQSEQALLKLCIQPGVTKKIDESVSKQTIRVKDKGGAYEGVSETDGIAQQELPDGNSRLEIGRSSKRTEEEVYRRQKDPDAMIASLDRLTAALVQQTEAMRERESSTMKQSIMSDTWNEDSPNDVSFPSISISAPLIASFKSDVPEEPVTIASESVDTGSNDSAHMTQSKIIQREAIRLAEAVDAEINRHYDMETNSMTSMDLDAIKPPSTMGSLLSLTASYTGPGEISEPFVNRDRCNSTSLPPLQVKTALCNESRGGRKKSLPVGVVAKRALSQGHSHNGSLENLLNECTGSHLENVKPPSMMDELPDVGDMENSMVSVASIMSEVADSKSPDSHSLIASDAVFDLLKPVANVLSMTCMRYAEAMQGSANNSLSECLENINPPSLFNEVCEMDESTMEPATETLCSDTLCIDVELKTEEVPHHPMGTEKINEDDNDTDGAATPLSSEYCVSSSAESTPKKRLHKNLTPKQKRSLVKERYKTYTIAAEMVKKEDDRRRHDGTGREEDRIPRGKCSPFSKLTPKQRRQEDRARFQTQVLDNIMPDVNTEQPVDPCNEEPQDKSGSASPMKSSIPTVTKLPVCKALRKKRSDHKENKERYRTRTLNDPEILVRDAECNVTEEESQDEIQVMLEQNATIVLDTLKETNKRNEMPLECETLSLVSIESESEQSMRMKFVSGLSKKLLDCAQTNSDGEHVEVEDRQFHEELGYNDPVDSESDDASNKIEEQPQETKRPRIIKPGTTRDLSTDSNVTDKSEPESPKAIRGRRKALYSNPITRKSTPQSSPLKQVNPVSGIPIGRSNTSPIVRATRATTLRQSNNSPSTANKDSSKPSSSPKMASADPEKRTRNLSAAAKRASVPQKGSNLTFTKYMKRHSTPPTCTTNFQSESKPPETPPKPLERQGTFTKDEPEVENAPTVLSNTGSPVKTKIAKPIRGASSKVHPTVAKPKITVKPHQVQQAKVTKANSSEKIPSPKGLPLLVAPKRNQTGSKVPITGKTAPTAQASGPNEGGKTFRKVGPLGPRSNSNSSIVSNTSSSVQTRKLAKEATSKIASLWKKVEESKKQRVEKPDTRQWIQTGNGATEVDGPSAKPPTFRLFRSSTFEGVPQGEELEDESLYKSKAKRPLAVGVQANKAKYRNSCDLSGMNANDAPCKIPVKSGGYPPDGLVIMRKQNFELAGGAETDPTKRISRLGSFIRIEANAAEASTQAYANGNALRTPASAIVPPFNYNPKQEIPSQASRGSPEEGEGKGFGVVEYRAEIATASTRVTTV